MNARKIVRIAIALVATSMLGTSVQAIVAPGLFRAYLAPTGNDANPCTLAAPCRLLPAALAAVADGGEIWMLDSANYNVAPVGITKSVTILAIPGAVGSVVATSGDAIDIATPGVDVTLRNLVIVPLPGAAVVDGIHMTDGASLVVDNCLIANLPSTGIYMSAPAKLRILGSTIRGSGNTAVFVHVSVPGSTTAVDIVESTIDGNTFGIAAQSSNATAAMKVSVRNSRIVQCASFAVVSQSDSGAAVTFTASGNVISNNVLYALGGYGAGNRIWASGNTVSGNGTGFLNQSGSIFESAGDNAVRNNGANSSGTISLVAPM